MEQDFESNHFEECYDVTDKAMTMAGLSCTVTPSAEQIPRICTMTGLFAENGLSLIHISDGEARARGGRRVAQRVERIGALAHFGSQPAHLGIAAGIVGDRAVSGSFFCLSSKEVCSIVLLLFSLILSQYKKIYKV